MTTTIENRLADRVRVGGFELSGARVEEQAAGLEESIRRECDALRSRFADPPAAAEWNAAARRLYRDLGIDPSRRRPSSEALLRRVLQGKGLYTVNTAVDAANLASLRIALPVGLYDRDRIVSADGTVQLRLGSPGESYPGIRKDEVNVAERPTLADDRGPFGNPSSDSERTQVTVRSTRLLFVAYAPVETPAATMAAAIGSAEEILLRHLGGDAEALLVR